MSLAGRKRIELERKLSAIDTELERWRERAKAGREHEKHHTQIERIGRHLDVLRAAGRDLLERTAADQLLGRWQAVEGTLLLTHRVWDFFRDKLSQRLDPDHRAFLRLVDELAWSAYRPAQRAYTPSSSGDDADPEDAFDALRARREPPLLFFSGRQSPFALSRDRPYRIAGLSVEHGRTVRRVLAALPVPVIGIPWSQIAHLPDALVVGHEAGHAVEHDFGLTGTLDSLLEDALEDVEKTHVGALGRLPAWRSWLGEAFADFYGCLLLGPAFVGALTDFLATDIESITAKGRQAPHWGEYPTVYLRILFCCQAIEAMGFDAEADERRRIWRARYPTHAMPTFETEIPHIVDRWLAGPYPTLGDQSLRAVLGFTANQQARALQTVEDVFNRFTDETDFRVLFAAAQLAFETDPKGFPKAEATLRRRLEKRIAPGTRGIRFESDAPTAAEDRAAAVALARLLEP